MINFVSSNGIKYQVIIYKNSFDIVFVINNDPAMPNKPFTPYRWGKCSFAKIDSLDLNYLGFPEDLFVEIKKAIKLAKLKKVYV